VQTTTEGAWVADTRMCLTDIDSFADTLSTDLEAGLGDKQGHGQQLRKDLIRLKQELAQ
jgi:hypothetical protein